MKIKTTDLMPPALNWAVATCLGHHEWENYGSYIRIHLPDHKQSGYTLAFCPSTDWAQGGPIIEREGMQLQMEDIGEWHATMWWDDGEGQREVVMQAATPLIAAMRCYVASKLGEEVDVPDELITK